MATSSEQTPLGPNADSYWVQSRGPLASLVFIAPLLLIYESGAVFFGVRNGADEFMRRLLNLFGFGQHFLLPFLTVCILLAWHYLSREPWRLSGGMLSAMAAEALLLGAGLHVISFVQHALITLSIGETIKEGVGFIGAGIYEELLFRLILLSLVAWALRKVGTGPRASMITAVVFTSLLFAAAHHVGPYGEWPVQWSRFLFRTIAGAYFSVIFLYRGFGIAAGAHAAYDVLTWFLG